MQWLLMWPWYWLLLLVDLVVLRLDAVGTVSVVDIGLVGGAGGPVGGCIVS